MSFAALASRLSAFALTASMLAPALPISAQDPVLSASQKLLDGYLKNARFNGSLFFYDVLDGEIAPTMVKIRNESPEVFDRVLYLYGSRADWVDRSHMPASAKNNGWPIEPRWWIVNESGTVVFSSTEVPTEEEILKQLDKAEIPSISQMLAKYYKENPDRVDALMRLLNHQYEVASKTVIKKHLLDNRWNESWGRFGFPPPELKRPLTSIEDEDIWAGFAKNLKLAVESEAWTQSNWNIPIIGNSPHGTWMPGNFMALSPTVKTLATQLLPRVTQIAKESPESVLAWKLWLILERAIGDVETNNKLSSLLNSIEERPFVSLDYPPASVVWRLREFSPGYGSQDGIVDKHYMKQFEAGIKDPIGSLGKHMEADRKSKVRCGTQPSI